MCNIWGQHEETFWGCNMSGKEWELADVTLTSQTFNPPAMDDIRDTALTLCMLKHGNEALTWDHCWTKCFNTEELEPQDKKLY